MQMIYGERTEGRMIIDNNYSIYQRIESMSIWQNCQRKMIMLPGS